MLIDIGVNLTSSQFNGQIPQVINAARSAGVNQIIITGTSLAASLKAIDLAQNYSLYSTAGVHPHDAKTWDDATAEALSALYQHTLVVAVGECGLDYNRNFSPPDVQRRVFEYQLKLAATYKLPVFCHDREAATDMAVLIEKYRSELTGVVIHCFTGSKAELSRYISLDCHIGITGWVCDERRGQSLARLVPQIPDNRLMLETDAPYLIPRSLTPKPKSRRNEPRYLPHIAQTVARLRGQKYNILTNQCYKNTIDFFKLTP